MRNQIKKPVYTLVAIGLVCGAAAVASAGTSTDNNLRDPDAEAMVKKMSDYLGGLKSFSADLYVFDEQIMGDGFKMSVLRSGTIKVKRPNKIFISRKGVVRDQETMFDGSHLVVYGKNIKMAIDVPVKGTIDAALDAAGDIFQAAVPGRDLISKDVYTPLMEVVKESANLGSIEIGDRTCRQLAFRTDEVDYQLWVQEGDQPLPCRYTITSKWTFAAPQYTVTFSNWQINQDIPDSDFTFTAPEGVKKTTVEEFRKALDQEINKK